MGKKMISSSQIDRFNVFKDYISTLNNQYGEYWTREGPSFDIELTQNGYINRGQRNYLPSFFTNQTDAINLSDYKSPYKRDMSLEVKYLTLGGVNFCTPLNSGNTTLRYAKYYDEIVENEISKIQNNTILEIGAGSGIFSALMQDRFSSKSIIVDIPYTLQNSIALFMSIYPEKNFILPNEISEKTNIYDYDLIFLTPDQKDLIKDNSIGLAINTQSFMEMDFNEVEDYFSFVNRIVVNQGYFFISNRMRKVTNFFNFPFDLLTQYKRIYLAKNNVFLRHNRFSTLIDCLLIKDATQNSSKVFNFFHKSYLNFFWMTKEERYGWIRSDLITLLRKIGINYRKN
jgi:hypothetical protein